VFRAVVFAYSEVGYRCLEALLNRAVDVPLVVTHEDAAGEHAWFRSVAELAAARGLARIAPAEPNTAELARQIAALDPHYVFSFYYRSLLGEPLRAGARWGALNMHGSLLPKYRGRAPVNWAILNGESETGVTLHYMVEKPDAGPIIAQQPVAIGRDDSALTVSLAVAAAAARLLERCLPQLACGPPPARAMDLAAGSYFGRRTPADGRIDLGWPAERVHALIRAVAPPFPGAFVDLGAQRIVFEGSRWSDTPAAHPGAGPCLYTHNGQLYLDLKDGRRLIIERVRLNGAALDAAQFARANGPAPLRLEP
jgi:methionyl-tRNA formyltransferase